MIFPIRIHDGGGLYGFCPAKATWDHEAVSIYETMVVAVEQKALLVEGGLANQPSWFVSMLAWFGPAYDTQKFISRAKMVLGDNDDKPRGSQPLQSPAGKQGKRAR